MTNPTTLGGPAAHGINPDEADAIITEMLRSGVVEGFVVHLAARFGSTPRGDVEDAVVDAVLDTRRRLESQAIDDVKAYVYRAAYYLLGRNANRRRRLVQFRESADGPMAPAWERGEVATAEIAAPPDSTETDEAIADRQDAALAFVKEIVGAWPGSSRRTVMLITLEAAAQGDQLTDAEIAERMRSLGKTLSTDSIRVWRHRAIQHLRQEMASRGVDYDHLPDETDNEEEDDDDDDDEAHD